MQVVESLQPDVAYILYDWHSSLGRIRQTIATLLPAGAKVTSVAVLAPGDKPACVGAHMHSWGWACFTSCLSTTVQHGGARLPMGCSFVCHQARVRVPAIVSQRRQRFGSSTYLVFRLIGLFG